MKYHKQTPNDCLAFAAYNLGAVDDEALAVYQKSTRANGGAPTWKQQLGWALSYAPWLADSVKVDAYTWQFQDRHIPPKGRGVALMWINANKDMPMAADGGAHAVSYEDGMVLDPAMDAPGVPETQEEMTKRWADEGLTIHFYEIAAWNR